MALAIALVALLAIVAISIHLNQPACFPQQGFIKPFLVTNPCDD